MRFYSKTQEEKIDCINRCFFETDHGYLFEAMERIKDLGQEFHDSKVYYAEGVLRRDFLGQGNRARELFEKAYNLDNNHVFALHNILALSVNEDNFRKWAQKILNSSDNEDITREDIKKAKYWLNKLDSGLDYKEYLMERSIFDINHGNHGSGAATLEIVLTNYEQSLGTELPMMRRTRAESLRTLDKELEGRRNISVQRIPPNERLVLQEAFYELEKAIQSDEYDPELWNLKSAWAILLGKPENAIDYAEKSIELGIQNYPKPYYNLALAYSKLKKFDESYKFAAKSVSEAKAADSGLDIKMAESFIKDLPRIETGFQTYNFELYTNLYMEDVRNFSEKFLTQWNLKEKKISAFILNKLDKKSSTSDYINVMAEVLSAFPPEIVFRVNLKIFDNKNVEIHEKCLISSLFIATYSTGIQRTDTTKFILMSILAAKNLNIIKSIYRELILAPSAASEGDFSKLNTIISSEINRLGQVGLNELITNQNPITSQEIVQAEKMLKRFELMEEPSDYINLLSRNNCNPSSRLLRRVINRISNNYYIDTS
ncbi:MAG: Tetratricopeptide repeat protein [Methanobacterium sp. PtaB.Bin024]|jgi:tetratricopeptide (TPR) repeat protein|nr:MAG: Tetratricopeptide repeat protein [Methanobacterium sp. PtaB.Bin024]